MITKMWLVGEPDSVARQIRELYERVGGFGTVLCVADDRERCRRSMRGLPPHAVMPRLADQC